MRDEDEEVEQHVWRRRRASEGDGEDRMSESDTRERGTGYGDYSRKEEE